MPDDARASPQKPDQPAKGDDGFDEITYLRAFSDVLDAVDRGDLTSGYEHYRQAGKLEGRLDKPEYRLLLAGDDRQPLAPAARATTTTPSVSTDTLVISRSGAILLLGWADDRGNALTGITVMSGGKPYGVWTSFPRLRRVDVGRALDGAADYPYGFWVFAAPNQRRNSESGAAAGECLIELHFAGGAVAEMRRTPQMINDRDLRTAVMTRLAGMVQAEARSIADPVGLDGRIGTALVEFNRSISHASLPGMITERFGPRRSHYRASIIVPLDHGHEHLCLQSCIFGQSRDIEDYEFIYIVNQSSDMEPIAKAARIAERTYGLPQTLILQPAEIDAGTGQNAAARLAQSNRLIFVRPEVFPRDPDWARQHTDLLAHLPERQTRLFGAAHYYDNGALRHAGLYFEHDMHVDSNAEAVTRHPALRIEAYGRGAPAWADQFTRSRAVPSVSAAFMSVDRAWFEKLGAFSESYQAGQYEDTDLCLRSLREGVPPWLHAIRMWQLDMTGPTASRLSEAGAILNRWLFYHRWASFIVPDLLGKSPSLAG